MYELEGTPLQLLECCDEPLRTAVSRDTGGETLGRCDSSHQGTGGHTGKREGTQSDTLQYAPGVGHR